MKHPDYSKADELRALKREGGDTTYNRLLMLKILIITRQIITRPYGGGTYTVHVAINGEMIRIAMESDEFTAHAAALDWLNSEGRIDWEKLTVDRETP